jgi:4-hydroxy-3-methylbut-2-enyl diphosphate reductase IspH
LETWDQFEPSMTEGKQVAGVTAGASTPEWVVREFVDRLEKI